MTVTGGTITHNATTTGQGRPIWMSSSVSVGANKGAQVRITGGTFTSGLTGDPAIQVGIASDTARMHGVLYITGGKFTTNSGSNNGIIVYSKDKWPTASTTGYLNYCGMGDTVHIGGSAQFTNNSTNADKCVLFASDGSYIHTPASYTGYVYSKNGYGICATDSGSKIAFNGGTIYAKNTSLFKRATNGATVTIGSSATTSVGAP